MSRVPVSRPILSPSPVRPRVYRCSLTLTPNEWGCHDPDCGGDSTWSHECPTPPCTVGASEPVAAR